MTEQSSDPIPCSQCGAPLRGKLESGLCAACMMFDALSPEPAEPSREPSENLVDPRCSPESFGDYELIEEIDHGGMGIVFKARQKKLNRIVALKTLLLGGRASPEMVERFRREAESAARLQHPNIVRIHEVGVFDKQPFFSMDFIDGQNLSEAIKEQSLPPS